MSIGIIGIDPTRVTTNAEFALGVRGALEDQTTGSGTREYIYASFVASTARAIGDVVLLNPVTGAAVGITAALAAAGQTAGRRIGVVTGTIASVAATQYGWVQIYGLAAVLADSGAAVGTAMYTSTTNAGRIGTTSASNVALSGVALNVAGNAPPATTNAFLNYPQVAV